ncbi:DUF5667 domain-containing protein [Patescibacteria group bacterium]|nr:DUF5667 domain-containing protein [Patescibacteria group bacterium]
MFRRIAYICCAFSVASLILFISVLKTASIKYAFALPASPQPTSTPSNEKPVIIDYSLAYPGSILPDSPFWLLKAARDRLWLFITTDSGKKADLMLLFADKRLASSKILFERNKSSVAFPSLSKGEKYLEMAVNQGKENTKKGLDTVPFWQKLANAALKHREVLEEILKIAPEDAKPGIVQSEDYAKNAFKEARDALNSKGVPVPENPFERP